MTDLFTKPITAITAEDITELLLRGPAEGPTVEYKAGLAGTRKAQDPWIEGDSKTADGSREKIVKEVVAFANTGGGTLVLGVTETKDDPPRPSEIRPIPRCSALAGHLTDVLKDAIDPALPLIHIQPVPIEDDAGIVVIRVPASRRAPHRCVSTRHVYKRFHHQSTPVDMREIQEMVLHTRTGLERLEQTFADRRRRFETEWGEAFPHSNQHGYVMAVTVVPIVPLTLDRLGADVPIGPALRDFTGTLVAGQRSVPAEMRSHVVVGRPLPIVRGVRLEGFPNPWVRAELHQSGVVDVWARLDEKVDPRSGTNSLLLAPSFIMPILINALLAGNGLRRRAGQPEAELAVSIAFHVPHRSCKLPLLMASWTRADFGMDEPWVRIQQVPELPRYSMAAISEISQLVRGIHRDLMDASGRAYVWDLILDTSELARIAGIGPAS